MKKSWEIMGGWWEVMWGLWGSWEVSEGSWEVSGRLKGGHDRSPGGRWRLVGRHCKMLIANAIAEQRVVFLSWCPLQEGIPTHQSEELNSNAVPISSPRLPAPVKKRGRKKDPAEVRALKAQIRIEQTRKDAEKIKELKKWWGAETESEGTWRLSCIVKIMQWFWKMCIHVKCHKWFFMFYNMLQCW